MKKYRLLVVDDRKIEVQEILDTNYNTNQYDVEVEYEQDFDKAVELLHNKRFDLIVLDLKKDLGLEKPGLEIFENIWNGINEFIPVIIFSAHYDNETFPSHNLVSLFSKTQEEEVIISITSHLKKLEKIESLRKKINNYMREGLRAIDFDESHTNQLQRMLGYIKNEIDLDTTDEKLPADIQYISIPEFRLFLSCDIIETIPGPNIENEYYMIMSPSCELNGKDKTTGQDLDYDVVCNKIIDCPNKNCAKFNEGIYMYAGSYVPLPDFEFLTGTKFKNKVVDLRLTRVIKKLDISKVTNETDIDHYKYRKIASISSPYRERIISASYHNRSRIGVPTLDENSWWRG